jgi:hypothetical protein
MFVLQNTTYGSVDFNYTGVGTAETRPAGIILPNPFNPNLIQGSRANISIHRNFWNGYGADQNAETILHELGYVYNFTRGSGGFRISNLTEGDDRSAFDKLIETNCKLNQH